MHYLIPGILALTGTVCGQSPLLTKVATLQPSAPVGVIATASLAMSGDTIVFGDNQFGSGDGTAYVFAKPASGWTNAPPTAQLFTSDTSDSFGRAVAIEGDTAVIGAPATFNGFFFQEGAAYVYEKPAQGWSTSTQTAKLTASDPRIGLALGKAAAVDDDTIVVMGPGKAYVYVKPPGGWADATETAQLTMSISQLVGGSVAIDGDVIAIGGSGTHLPGANSAGAIFVYVRPPGGWTSTTETAILTASNPTPSAGLGRTVSISGDVIAAGSSQTVYVFEKPPSGWGPMSETARLTPQDPFPNFGRTVSVAGTRILASDTTALGTCDRLTGMGYRFEASPTGWVTGNETERLINSAPVASGIGGLVATNGTTDALWDGARNVIHIYDETSPVVPSTLPTLDGVTPSSYTALDAPNTLALTGRLLHCPPVSGREVTVDGIPAEVMSGTATTVRIRTPAGLSIGAHTAVFSNGTRTSNPVTFWVDAVHPSVLVAPSNHDTATTASYLTYTDAGWSAVYMISGTPGPTALPGIVNLEIGGGVFANIAALIGLPADAAGIADLQITMPPGLPTPFTLYWECITLDPAVPLGLQAPLETSNSAAVTTGF